MENITMKAKEYEDRLWENFDFDIDELRFTFREIVFKYPEVLEEAVKIVKTKDNHNSVKFPIICHCILIFSKYVDMIIYNKLINAIYSDAFISMTIADQRTDGSTFLMLSLQNVDFKLSEEQKTFAINLAYNQAGLMKINQAFETYINQDVLKEPTEIIAPSSNNSNCTLGIYDLRYWIMYNQNFTDDEVKDIAFNLYPDENEWNKLIREVQNDILDLYGNNGRYHIDIRSVINFSREEIFQEVGIVDMNKIYYETNFLKKLLGIRPTTLETGNYSRTKK